MPNCPYCKRYFPKKAPTVEHINRYHADRLEADGMDACQALYFSTHGCLSRKCMCGCGRDTQWSYELGKPYAVSDNPECRKRLSDRADENMMKTYGKTTLLNDMDRQREMQHHRPTAGKYKFADGGTVPYLSKPEETFLRFCDQIMELKSWCIQSSPEIFKYWDPKAQKERQYDPDFYLPDYNLLVEIKDGGSHTNTNPAFVEETKYKVALKDAAMKKQTKYNFIKIVDNKFGPFVELLYQIVHVQGPEGYEKPKKNLVVITEQACFDIDEHIDLVSITETFTNMFVATCEKSGLPSAFVISESPNFYRVYLYDYTQNTIRESTMDDPILQDGIIKTYKYIGESAKVDSFMKRFISQCLVESAGYDANPLYDLLSEGIYFYNDMDRNNNERRMNFIKVGEYVVS